METASGKMDSILSDWALTDVAEEARAFLIRNKSLGSEEFLVHVKVVRAADFKTGSKRKERTESGNAGGNPDIQPSLLRCSREVFLFSLVVLPRGDTTLG